MSRLERVHSIVNSLRVYWSAICAGLIVIALLLAMFLWRSALAQSPSTQPPAPLPVAAQRVKATQIPISLNAVGSLRAVQQVILSAEAPGRVVRINFQSGGYVSRGQLIVQLNDRAERAERQAFQAAAQLASIQLERSSELVALGAESQQKLDEYKAERQRVSAEIGRVGAQIDKKTVYAPFSGKIGINRINLGQYLNPGDPIATLTNLDEIYVEFQIPQIHTDAVARGLPVSISVDGWSDRSFSGLVEAVETQIDRDSRNILVQARIRNSDGALKPGMFVNTKLELGVRQDVLMVPATALISSSAGDSVMIVDKIDHNGVGTAKVVPVTSTERIGEFVVITDGIEAGNRVITAGQLRIRPDLPVQIQRTGEAQKLPRSEKQ